MPFGEKCAQLFSNVSPWTALFRELVLISRSSFAACTGRQFLCRRAGTSCAVLLTCSALLRSWSSIHLLGFAVFGDQQETLQVTYSGRSTASYVQQFSGEFAFCASLLKPAIVPTDWVYQDTFAGQSIAKVTNFYNFNGTQKSDAAHAGSTQPLASTLN